MNMGRQEARQYLLLDSLNAPLGQGEMETAPGESPIRMLVLNNDIDEVVSHEIIVVMGVGSNEAPLQCKILRHRGDRVMLEKIATLDPELRRNLRVPIKFKTFIYPLAGSGWRGRQAVQSIDLSCGGLAFYGDSGLEVGEQMELVIPVTEEPVILRCEVLREQELRNGKMLYAVKFIDMCEDEEVTVREAGFSIQLQNRPDPAMAGRDNRKEHS